jgi:hypothetical protein
MPFHPGGYKPHSQPKRVASISNRLLVTMCGGVLIFGGVFRIQRGFEYTFNWWGDPVYAYGLIIAGVIVIPLAWIPARWTEKVFAGPVKERSGRFGK